ncbi:MAG: dTDP-4-dehydrorhamnose reductase [Ignavibacteria bacterium]|nr:dTDP-4-dehydrorhamnose reductase [Ignavibacteria bacterium]
MNKILKKILIIGSNGLLGQAIVTLFTRESDFNLILSSIEEESFLSYGQEYVQLDITKKDDVKEIVKHLSPNVIINCAAYTAVDKCETERELCWKLNVDAVKNLIIASRPYGIKIVHYSTDYVFDGVNGPYTEEAIPNPISFYGRSKLASENALITSGIDYVIIRTMVLVGTGKNVKPNFAEWLINKIKNNESVNIVDDQIGNTTMADDLAYGTLKIVEKDCKGIYNIAGGDIISRLEYAYKVCEVFNLNKKFITPIKTNQLNQPAPRPFNSGLITHKAEAEFGFKAMDSLEGLRYLKVQLGY